MSTIAQRSFSSGEISPSLYARVDLLKYATGLRTCKNMQVLRYGGVSNRAGTKFICEAEESSETSRIIPFVFNTEQTYVLEFGNEYIRVIKNGALLTDTATTATIVLITRASPAVVTTGTHGYTTGDEITITDVVGMPELNNRQFRITVLSTTTFSLQDKDSGTTDIDSSAYGAYASAGTSEKIYQVTTPYQEAELFELNHVQSGDVLSIVHPSHSPRELSRTGDISWNLTETVFIPTIPFPTYLTATKGGAGSEVYRYKVTSVDADTGEESLAGTIGLTKGALGATQANPCVITSSGAHGYATDDEIFLDFFVGMTELNKRNFYVNVLTSTTYELVGIDSTNYTAYASAGGSKLTFAEVTAAAAPTVGAPHVIAWLQTDNAIEYNIYKELNGVYGQIGVATGTSFNDINITANTTYTPPTSRNPFVGANNYPSTVTYVQQRKAYANTLNDPEKIFLSRVGNFDNFTYSSPIQSDDAVTFTMAGNRVNEVKYMLDLGRLVVGTSSGEWSANGNDSGTITPTSINNKQYSYNGSGDLSPIVIDGAAIYQQARGSIIRDLSYDLNVDGYAGNDLTIFSAHLFDKFTLKDWAFQQVPHSTLWVVRSDGALLGLTFVRSQQVTAWHIHELSGDAESVTVIPEGNEDVLYIRMKRTVDGKTRRYIEKLTTRQINGIEDSIFMDSTLSYEGRNTGSIDMTLSGGTTWAFDEDLTLTASGSFFLAGDVGNAIHLTDSLGEVIRCSIVAYTSATIVTIHAHKTVPATLRATSTVIWTKAVDELVGLDHLEGKEVSILGDGFVVANPNNDSYDTVTVTNGAVTLDKPYGIIHVGLPYISDIQTLNIDTVQGETIADKKQIISKVSMFVEDTRGVWAGSKPPVNDTIDPLEGLQELKSRNAETYDNPIELKTEVVDINIRSEWNSNGRVFIRQVDPLPITILSVMPAGKIPIR